MFRGAADEARAPKYAYVERERRFLVDPARRPDLDGRDHILIEDRYVTGTRLRVRRMTGSATGAVACKLTQKYEADDPLARPIVTTYLDMAEYELLAALPARLLVKRRYPVDVDGQPFAIDRFEGPLVGLELAEIDADDASQLAAVTRPDWAVAEVSHDPFFQSGHLASLDATALQTRLAALLG